MPKTDVRVALVGQDGNAFAIMGRVSAALQRAGHGDLVDQYVKEATSGDYDNLLRVTMEYVEDSSADEVDDDEEDELAEDDDEE